MIRMACVSMSLLLFGLCLENSMYIERKYRKTYTTTVTRAVGPTTEIGQRGTLPNTSPTDLNTVYLAPNGSDAGANGAAGTGTFAAPVLTLAKVVAVIAAQPARNNCVIIRNGAVGNLQFPESASLTLPDSCTLQVVEGEIAYFTGGLPFVVLTGSNVQVNGIDFMTSALVQNTGETGSIYSNCASLQIGTISNSTSTVTINYCYASQFIVNPASGSGKTFTNNINNCLIENRYVSAITSAVFNNPISIASTTGNTITFNIARSFLRAFPYPTETMTPVSGAVISCINSGAASTVNLNIASSVLSSSLALIATRLTTAFTVNLNLDNSQNSTPVSVTVIDNSATITVNKTDDSPIDSTAPRLFVDEQAIFNQNPAAFKLQAIGKATPNGSGRYQINSPLIDAGVAGVDAAPWDETTVLTSAEYTEGALVPFPPRSIAITVTPINPTTTYDARGNAHQYHDALRRQMVLTWGAGNVVTPDAIRMFVALLGDQGTKRLYPARTLVDEIGDLWEQNGTATGTYTQSSGSTNATFAPTLMTPAMIEFNWAGFWLEFEYSSDTYRFYIASNTSTSFELVNKEGFTEPPAGLYAFAIRFILVSNNQDPITFTQQDFSEFLLGGRWRESDLSPSVNQYEFTTDSLTLLEAEDDEEAL